MAKILVFSNLKGGVGKSTLCCHFAHYLSAKGENVVVLDADTSQNIYNMRQRELKRKPDAELHWKVWQLAGQQNVVAIIEKLKQLDGYVLVDCPGTLSDPALLTVFKAADVAVIPFRYDDYVVDSTMTFVKILRKEAPSVKMLFVPNIIKLNVKYALEAQATEMFNKVGLVSFRVKDGVAIQRLSTITQQDEYQAAATAGAFQAIYTLVR